MTIRFAQDKDLTEIKSLLLQVNNIHAEGRPDIFIKDSKKYKDEEIIAQLHDPQKVIFAYTDDNDKLIGYAFCQIQLHENITNMHPYKTLYIDDLCVDERYRRQHIGQTLLKHVVNWAKEHSYHNVALNVWECNSSAKAFYEKMGMRVQRTFMEQIL